MSAFFIFDNREVTNPAGLEEYARRAPLSVEKYGGRYRVRGGAHEVIEGEWRPRFLIILEFPSLQQARDWYGSAEYSELKQLRHGASVGHGVLVAGLDEEPGKDIGALAAVEAVMADLATAWRKKDAERILSHFAAGAKTMEPGMTASGLAAIRQYVLGAIGSPDFGIDMTTDKIDVSAHGDLGYARGRFQMRYLDTENGSIATQSGHFVAVLRQQPDASWKIVEDISTIGPEA